MRKAGIKTPTSRQEQKEDASLDKSGKKLVQARLPFKIITPSSKTAADGLSVPETDCANEDSSVPADGGSRTNEVRKRKLSYHEVSDAEDNLQEVELQAKENLSSTKSKKKKNSTPTITTEEEVVLLDDSDDQTVKSQHDPNKVKKLLACNSVSPKTPINNRQKRKGAGTPKSANAVSGSSAVGGAGGESGESSKKLQIKLPLSGKKKRRKSQRKSGTKEADMATEQSFTESGDDIEIVSAELNPTKRLKVGSDNDKKEILVEVTDQENNDDRKLSSSEEDKKHEITYAKNSKSINRCSLQPDSITTSEMIPVETVDISDSDTDKSNKEEISAQIKSDNTFDTFFTKSETNIKQKTVNNDPKIIDSKKSNSSFKTSELKSVCLDDDDVEAKDDDDIANSSASSIVGDNEKNGKPTERIEKKVIDSPAPKSPLPNAGVPSNQNKNLTPKQLRLMEQRKKAREDKERRLQEQKEERDRKIQEEKLQKLKEKEEKEQAKKREREEKEEQKRKEREEKDEIKRKEREEKERKRLAEVEAKNEERRKRNEIKEEELRKKEEERKRKEQEREEAENKKKKAAEAFTKFFVPKSNQRLKNAGAEDEELKIIKDGIEKPDCSEILAFRPFQIKGDMQLAPLCRKAFSTNAREGLDSFVCENSKKEVHEKDGLYLFELKTGKVKPGKWRRPTIDVKPDDEDVVIVEDELERAAQAIIEEHTLPVERYRAKFFKFHENRRPPYFGTWRKKTNIITPRRPLAQDNKYFDYEVDSDLEWEEEEPGESLDGSDDEKEKESEDDDYEVDNEWFVPHGHLSDEEMQNEDECGIDVNTREAQKAKLKILQQEFAQEMKKKTEKIKPRLIGCIWQDYEGNQPELCPNIIWNSLNLRAMLCTSAPIIEEPLVTETVNDAAEPNSPTTSTSSAQTDKRKPISLTESMYKDLIRLVHGNRHKKDFIIKEFIAFVEQTEPSILNGEVRGPLKSVVREKIDEFALWQIIELNNNSKTKKIKKKLCWIVSDEILKKYELQNLDLHNTWNYKLQPKFVDDKILSSDKNTTLIDSTDDVPIISKDIESQRKKIKRKKPGAITKYAKVLSAEEKAQKLHQKSESAKVSLAATSPMLSDKKEAQNVNIPADTKTVSLSPKTVKKRVPLLMSVARGQSISTPTKNALISQFLKKSKEEATEKANIVSKSTTLSTSPMDIDEVVLID